MKESRVPAVCLAAVAYFAAPAPADSKVEGKKILKLFGWDKPVTSFLLGHIGEIERAGFDGISIIVMPDKEVPKRLWGNDANYLWFSRQAVSREDFTKAVAIKSSADEGPGSFRGP